MKFVDDDDDDEQTYGQTGFHVPSSSSCSTLTNLPLDLEKN